MKFLSKATFFAGLLALTHFGQAQEAIDPNAEIAHLKAEIAVLKAENRTLKDEKSKQTVIPTEKEAEATFKEIIESKSGGRVRVVAFKKTDGLAKPELYVVAYEATIEFLRPSIWNQASFAVSGEFSVIDPETARRTIPEFGDIPVKPGEKFRFEGGLTMAKTEKGWASALVGARFLELITSQPSSQNSSLPSKVVQSATTNGKQPGGPNGNLYAEAKIRNLTPRTIKVYLDGDTQPTELKSQMILFKKYLVNTTHKIKLEGSFRTIEKDFLVDDEGCDMPIN